MKKIIKITLILIISVFLYKIYLEKDKTTVSKNKEKRDTAKKIEDIILLKKSINHFEPTSLKNIKKYSDKEGFKVGPFILEFNLINESFITIKIFNSKDKLVTPKSLSKISLVIDKKIYDLKNVKNGLMTTKIIEDVKNIEEVTIWGKYKERTFSAKQKFIFNKKDSIQ